MERVKVFLASPSDVIDERDIVTTVASEVNRMFSSILSIEFDVIRWETHTWPDIGDDAQDVINREIGVFDIFIGIMWKRIGTATKRSLSGTKEEFERAYDYYNKYGRPRIMFYFKTSPFYSKTLNDVDQFRHVTKFRKKLENLGVLYWEYQESIEFERRFREHLVRSQLDRINSDPYSKRRLFQPTNNIRNTEISRRNNYKVFFAYSHIDKVKVREVYTNLQKAGFSPWIDEQDLIPGMLWQSQIDEAILASKAFVMFFSSKTFGSTGYFLNELNKIKGLNKTIGFIPVRIDNIDLPESFASYQCIDLFLPNGLDSLVSAIDTVYNIAK